MNKKLKVYIADDHTLFRKAMVNLLKTFDCVGEVKDAENGRELLTLIKYETPDVTLVDLEMPIMSGTDTCEAILKKYPDIKIIILTMHDTDRYILHMMEMGVHAYLLKNTEPHELEQAIQSVVAKDFYHNDLVASILRKNVKAKKQGVRPVFETSELSDREREVIRLVCEELTNKEIGEKLGITESTVKSHKSNIMDKIRVTNTVGLVKYAYESGLFS
jgi:two-component system, NarL family, response regulator DegU